MAVQNDTLLNSVIPPEVTSLRIFHHEGSFILTVAEFGLFWAFMLSRVLRRYKCLDIRTQMNMQHEMRADLVETDSVREQLRRLFFSRILYKLFTLSSILESAALFVARECLATFQSVGSSFTLIRVDVEVDVDSDTLAPKTALLCTYKEADMDPFLAQQEDQLLGSAKQPMTLVDSSSLIPAGNKRGRPKKSAQIPQVVDTGFRRSTRQNSQGYKHEAIPYDPPRRATASKTKNPEVLRLEEMRRMGIEKCKIEPQELTDEKLLRPRD